MKIIPGSLLVIFLLILAGGPAQAAPSSPAAPPVVGGCQVFPPNNIWNTPVDNLPVHARSAEWINAIGAAVTLHADFGSGTWDGGPIGIPFNVTAGSTVSKASFDWWYPEQSDPGPYPIPASPNIEWGSDHHLLTIDSETCKLYELYAVDLNAAPKEAGSGAIFDLGSNALRPATWTSADAAGLPIFPGLVRYDEVAGGEITHALRFTVNNSQNGYVWPARHNAPYNPNSHSPVMGLRLRLKANFNLSGFPAEVQVILRGLKKYGMIIADNGSSWFINGISDERWNNDNLHRLSEIAGSNFEVVDESILQISPDSAQAKIPRLWIPVIRITPFSQP